jgi:CO dehydrogenase nickel-insertion accessory protein CooC1
VTSKKNIWLILNKYHEESRMRKENIKKSDRVKGSSHGNEKLVKQGRWG